MIFIPGLKFSILDVVFFQLVKSKKLRHFSSIHGKFFQRSFVSTTFLLHCQTPKCFFLTLVDGLHEEMKTPCVVFTGHPSLRVGNVVHFLEFWGGSSSNTVIITGNLRFQNLLLNLLQKHVCKNDITIARKLMQNAE